MKIGPGMYAFVKARQSLVDFQNPFYSIIKIFAEWAAVCEVG
jgi:hypothetical protein